MQDPVHYILTKCGDVIIEIDDEPRFGFYVCVKANGGGFRKFFYLDEVIQVVYMSNKDNKSTIIYGDVTIEYDRGVAKWSQIEKDMVEAINAQEK